MPPHSETPAVTLGTVSAEGCRGRAGNCHGCQSRNPSPWVSGASLLRRVRRV